jgi:hypothetical protein
MILFWKRSFEAIAAGGGGGLGVPEFSDNASAIAGGLAVGYVYRTGGDLKIVI